MITLQQLQESIKIIADPVQNNAQLIEDCVLLGERIKEAVTLHQNSFEYITTPEVLQTLENCLGFALMYHNETVTILPDEPAFYYVHPDVKREILERLNIEDTAI